MLENTIGEHVWKTRYEKYLRCCIRHVRKCIMIAQNKGKLSSELLMHILSTLFKYLELVLNCPFGHLADISKDKDFVTKKWIILEMTRHQEQIVYSHSF